MGSHVIEIGAPEDGTRWLVQATRRDNGSPVMLHVYTALGRREACELALAQGYDARSVLQAF